jgi:hypothetical protein
MTVFDSYSRDQLRQSYLDAWRKQRSGTILTPLEAMIAEVIGVHPEYQPLLEDSVKALAEDCAAEPAANPFLHLGLHMAVREQVTIDRPPGVRALHQRLVAQSGDAHRADHLLMDALAETLWEAQRAGRAPDEARYLQLARRHCAQG